MIDAFRHGFIGYSDEALGAGIAVVAGINLVLCLARRSMFASGYKLKF